MAGPGGGPPRRSHTKSRKGCVTCKRRHIRCDETFPQCNNCTKHKIRCPYRNVQLAEMARQPKPDKPDLMWTPEIERAISDWQRTGMFPFEDLRVYPTPEAHLYSLEELRLIYHPASVYVQLAAIDANNLTLWTRHIPALLRIGATHRYVMHALLAFSAMHIAFLTDCPLVTRMALKHRGIALNGLHAAISSFSRETSDAILAASLVLSWQATDWQSWTQLMQGTLTVIKSMSAWQHESEFMDFIAETQTITELPSFSNPEHMPHQPRPMDLKAYQDTLAQMVLLKENLKPNSMEVTQVHNIINFLKDTRKRPMLSAAQQFEFLQPLRTWICWEPISALQNSKESINSLVVVAHLYTVALLMSNLFPDIGTSYFASLCLGPIEEIGRHIVSSGIAGPNPADMCPPLANPIQFPLNAAQRFRLRMGWPRLSGTRRPSQLQGLHHGHGYGLDMGNDAQAYMPYGNPDFNCSSDSVSIIIGPGYSPSETHSPLGLSFPTHPQYLNIPSPSFQVAHFSDRNSLDGSVTHSEGEEYGSFDARSFHAGFFKHDSPVLVPSQQASPLLHPASGGMLSLPASPVSASSPAFHPNSPAFHLNKPGLSATQYVDAPYHHGNGNGNGVVFAPHAQTSPLLHPTYSGIQSLPASPTVSSNHEWAMMQAQQSPMMHAQQSPLMLSEPQGLHPHPLSQAPLSPTFNFGIFE